MDKNEELEGRKAEIIKHMVLTGKEIFRDYQEGRYQVDMAIKLAIFSTLVILDGESIIYGAEVRPIIERKSGEFDTLEDIAGSLHHDFDNQWDMMMHLPAIKASKDNLDDVVTHNIVNMFALLSDDAKMKLIETLRDSVKGD